MHFYLKENSHGDALFCIFGQEGSLCYRVTGDLYSINGRAFLEDAHGVRQARIHRMGTASLATYTVYVEGQPKARLLFNLALPGEPFKIKSPPWSLRGDPLSRSFDIVDVDRSVVMTHGCCWNVRGGSYGLDIADNANTALCLCVAAVVDSIQVNSANAPIGVY